MRIQSLINSHSATSPSDGHKVYEAAYGILRGDDHKIIELDFKGISSITTVFLNHLVGHLLKDYDRSRIKIVNISKFQQDLVEKVMSNAETYYKRNAQQSS